MRPHQKRRKVAGALVGGSAGLVVVLVLFLLIRTTTIAEVIEQEQNENATAIELIQDCTTRGGTCFENERKRTRTLIRVLNGAGSERAEFILAVIACADRPGIQTLAGIRACADRKARNNE